MAAQRPVPVATPRRPLGQRLCRLVVRAFAYAYLITIGLIGLGIIDPFGVIPRPLIGVFLVILGLPWTLISAAFPDAHQPLVAALAPLLNWIVLGLLCAWQRLRRRLREVDH